MFWNSAELLSLSLCAHDRVCVCMSTHVHVYLAWRGYTFTIGLRREHPPGLTVLQFSARLVNNKTLLMQDLLLLQDEDANLACITKN